MATRTWREITGGGGWLVASARGRRGVAWACRTRRAPGARHGGSARPLGSGRSRRVRVRVRDAGELVATQVSVSRPCACAMGGSRLRVGFSGASR